MKENASILIIDDDTDILATARMFLKQFFSVVQVETNPDNVAQMMGEHDYDVILLDMNFKKGTNEGAEGFSFLDKILSVDPSAVVIFITAYGGVDLAVKSIKNGAYDFIMKPWKNDKMLATINSALQLKRSKHEVKTLKEQKEQINSDIQGLFNEMIGESLAMKKVYDIISRVAETHADILILGENGTGKELIAREIHRQSRRSHEIFLKVDLGAIHENLFESELFGHVKGAFTDAVNDKPGRFEIASKGTIFLDEIANLSLPLQAKLLSALQNRKVSRVGSNKEIDIDIRLICATNMPLYDMVGRREFREDLLYRINMVELRVPPLRERTGDIPLLINHFLEKYKTKYKKKNLRLNAGTVKRLEKYSWPGNIRELEHLVERAVILNESEVLGFTDLSITNEATLEHNEGDLNLGDMEKRYILKAISRNNGNMTRAAKDLGLTRTALYRRLDKYGL